jgi:acyl-CoA synthetase (AMP-forming)/AMP-acid ligase II
VDVNTLFRRAVARFGDRVALIGPQGTQTYTQLGSRVEALASALLTTGLRPGDRVLDLQPNQNSYVETDLACMAAGLVRVALNYRLHTSDWERIAQDCQARALIYDDSFAERAEPLRSDLDISIMVGPQYERLIDTAPPLRPVTGELVSLNYTSGTTGRPKGVRRAHSNRMASLANMTLDVLGGPPAPDDIYLHAGPITHTSGLFVLPFLAAGAGQLILPSFDADAVVDAVRHRGVTHTALVPTMIARILATADADRMPGLKMLGYAGAPMPPDQIRQAHQRLTDRLVQYYGLVEAIPPVTVLDAADHLLGITEQPDLLTSAGRPGLTIDLRIVDDDGRELPAAETGEVVTRGPHVMAEYWSSGDTTKTIRDGWLHTGDLGRVDTTGRLWLVDRKGDMILTGGYNVYPREIEAALAEVPGVTQVAVYGAPDPEWGQRIVCAYTGTASDEDVLRYSREHLASYKKPKQLRKLDEFPLNSTGKIDKKALAADD